MSGRKAETTFSPQGLTARRSSAPTGDLPTGFGNWCKSASAFRPFFNRDTLNRRRAPHRPPATASGLRLSLDPSSIPPKSSGNTRRSSGSYRILARGIPGPTFSGPACSFPHLEGLVGTCSCRHHHPGNGLENTAFSPPHLDHRAFSGKPFVRPRRYVSLFSVLQLDICSLELASHSKLVRRLMNLSAIINKQASVHSQCHSSLTSLAHPFHTVSKGWALVRTLFFPPGHGPSSARTYGRDRSRPTTSFAARHDRCPDLVDPLTSRGSCFKDRLQRTTVHQPHCVISP
ncbi:hypothetical protein OF83DRAFT_534490 [Amylostereum chailletii]|nr:hypothetical protein OF83DRAFT_534490 [Amylostereum chailletii]